MTKEKEIVAILEAIREGEKDPEIVARKIRFNLPKKAYRQDGALYAIWSQTINNYLSDIRRVNIYCSGVKITLGETFHS
jgi:hypothetical protein